MKRNQAGFTLIELIVVIVILGILSAVALPKFLDLSVEASNAAAQGVAGSISSGSAINYSARAAGRTTGTVAMNVANVCTTALAGALATGVTFVAAPATSSEFLIAGTGDCSAATAPGTAVTCTVKGQKGVAQNATVICSS